MKQELRRFFAMLLAAWMILSAFALAEPDTAQTSVAYETVQSTRLWEECDENETLPIGIWLLQPQMLSTTEETEETVEFISNTLMSVGAVEMDVQKTILSGANDAICTVLQCTAKVGKAQYSSRTMGSTPNQYSFGAADTTYVTCTVCWVVPGELTKVTPLVLVEEDATMADRLTVRLHDWVTQRLSGEIPTAG